MQPNQAEQREQVSDHYCDYPVMATNQEPTKFFGSHSKIMRISHCREKRIEKHINSANYKMGNRKFNTTAKMFQDRGLHKIKKVSVSKVSLLLCKGSL